MLQSDLSGNGLVASESIRVSLIHNVFFVGVGKRNLKIRQVGHIGYQPRFSSIGDIKIAQENDGRFVGNGYSCRLDSAIKAIGRGMGGNNGDRTVAITRKHALQKIALFVFSRQTRAWLQQGPDLHPVELAAEAHYRLVTIHPFADGNGRTARLLMNLILLMTGYPTAIIRKLDREAYLGALEKAQLGGSQDDYLQLIYKAVNRSLDIYLRAARGEDAEVEVDDSLLKIGELAKRTGENNSTIRYWTKEGLLEVAEVTESGYQLYSPEMIKRVEQIYFLKKERLTLQEIKERISQTE